MKPGLSYFAALLVWASTAFSEAVITVSTNPTPPSFVGSGVEVSPLLYASIAPIAPILPSHPAPEDVPKGGAFYRVTNAVDNTVLELWYVRDADHIATQLSAHDANGKSIIKTRDIDTGVETTIGIEEISIDVPKRNELRQDGRAIKADLEALVDRVVTNINLIKANNVNTNANATAVRTGLIKNTAADEETNKLLKQALKGNLDLTILVLQLMKEPK